MSSRKTRSSTQATGGGSAATQGGSIAAKTTRVKASRRASRRDAGTPDSGHESAGRTARQARRRSAASASSPPEDSASDPSAEESDGEVSGTSSAAEADNADVSMADSGSDSGARMTDGETHSTRKTKRKVAKKAQRVRREARRSLEKEASQAVQSRKRKAPLAASSAKASTRKPSRDHAEDDSGSGKDSGGDESRERKRQRTLLDPLKYAEQLAPVQDFCPDWQYLSRTQQKYAFLVQLALLRATAIRHPTAAWFEIQQVRVRSTAVANASAYRELKKAATTPAKKATLAHDLIVPNPHEGSSAPTVPFDQLLDSELIAVASTTVRKYSEIFPGTDFVIPRTAAAKAAQKHFDEVASTKPAPLGGDLVKQQQLFEESQNAATLADIGYRSRTLSRGEEAYLAELMQASGQHNGRGRTAYGEKLRKHVLRHGLSDSTASVALGYMTNLPRDSHRGEPLRQRTVTRDHDSPPPKRVHSGSSEDSSADDRDSPDPEYEQAVQAEGGGRRLRGNFLAGETLTADDYQLDAFDERAALTRSAISRHADSLFQDGERISREVDGRTTLRHGSGPATAYLRTASQVDRKQSGSSGFGGGRAASSSDAAYSSPYAASDARRAAPSFGLFKATSSSHQGVLPDPVDSACTCADPRPRSQRNQLSRHTDYCELRPAADRAPRPKADPDCFCPTKKLLTDHAEPLSHQTECPLSAEVTTRRRNSRANAIETIDDEYDSADERTDYGRERDRLAQTRRPTSEGAFASRRASDLKVKGKKAHSVQITHHLYRPSSLSFQTQSRMVTSGDLQGRSGAIGLKMEPYVPGSSMDVRDWIHRLHLYFQMTRTPTRDWVTQAAWLQTDPTVSRRMLEMSVLPGEEAYDHYARVMKFWLSRYTPTESELRGRRLAHRQIKKTSDENIDDFNGRYLRSFRLSHPGKDIDESHHFDDYLLALDHDYQRHAAGAVFSPGGEAGVDDQGRRRLLSWDAVSAHARTFYGNRNPRDTHDENQRSLAEYEAKTRVAQQSSHATLTGLDHTYTGIHARSLADTSRDFSQSGSSVANPAPSPSTLALFHRSLRDSHSASQSHSGPPGGKPNPPSGNRDGHHRRDKKRASRVTTTTNSADDDDSDATPQTTVARVATAAPSSTQGRPAAASSAVQVSPVKNEKSGASKFTTPRTPGGPCPDCCLPHDWIDCARNPQGKRPSEYASRYQNKGKHPKAADSDVATVIAIYGSVGVPVGQEPKRKDGRQSRAIYRGPCGQSEIVVEVAFSGLLSLMDGSKTSWIIRAPQSLVDTGSHVTLMSSRFYTKHAQYLGGLGPIPTYTLTVANNSRARVAGTLRREVTIRDPRTATNHVRSITFLVIGDMATDILLGMDSVTEFFSSINVLDGTFEFRQTYRVQSTRKQAPLAMREDAVIAPYHGHAVKVSYPGYFTLDPRQAVECSPCQVTNHDGSATLNLHFPPQLQDGRRHSADSGPTLYVYNNGSVPLSLPTGLIIGTVRLVRTAALRVPSSRTVGLVRRENPNQPEADEDDWDALEPTSGGGTPASQQC